jgi:hypothetical protein
VKAYNFYDPQPGCAPTLTNQHNVPVVNGQVKSDQGQVCGRVQYDLWEGVTQLAYVVVDSGKACGPTITEQPGDWSIPPGSGILLRVTATGTAPLSYQWYRDGSPLAGATSATLSLANVQHADAAGYGAVVSNDVGSTPTRSAVLTVSDTVPTSIYDVAGFAEAATGGGLIPESDPNYRKVFNADDLVAALGNNATKVIEVMNDLDLGFNEVPASARTGALRSASAPLLHPVLLASGVSLIDIQDKNGLTIFSQCLIDTGRANRSDAFFLRVYHDTPGSPIVEARIEAGERDDPGDDSPKVRADRRRSAFRSRGSSDSTRRRPSLRLRTLAWHGRP